MMSIFRQQDHRTDDPVVVLHIREKQQKIGKTIILSGLILLKFALQYALINPVYELHRDEFLYLDQGNHLAWGYLSVPPFTSWTSYIIRLLGNGVFWVKFFPALYGALTIYVVWKAIETLDGDIFALILGAFCIEFSVLLRLNTLYQPNSFDILAWTTLYFIVMKYVKTQQVKWLLMGAVVFAIGFLNKYNIVFLLLGLFPAILLSEHRRIFIHPAFYLSMMIGLLLILPNLLWQFHHGFPVYRHLRELSDTQLVNVERVAFIRSQLIFNLGAIAVLVAACYALLFYQPFQSFRFFFWALIFTLSFYVYFRGKDYYALGIYPIYMAFGAVFLSRRLKHGWKRLFKPVVLMMPLLMFIALYQVAFPNKRPEYIVQHTAVYKALGMLRWEDGKDHLLPQDFADMLGWKALAMKVDSIYAHIPHAENTWILCDNYGEAGAINYYSKNPNINASAFSADYIHWIKNDEKIINVILVKEHAYDLDRTRNKEKLLFDTVYLAAQRINKFAREDTISIYVLENAKTDIHKRVQEELNKHADDW